MSQKSPPHEYPNVKARLHLTKMAPALPKRESYMDIWMKGTRFRVCDESGNDVSILIGDLVASRGLGMPARTIEEIMDVWSLSKLENTSVTELYGDIASTEGSVYQRGEPAWPLAAERLAPVAEQILVREFHKQLKPQGKTDYLGRVSTKYHGFLEGEEEGIQYRSEVTCIVSPPYLLYNNIRDAQITDYYYTREVISLDEGAATDSDLTPP